MGSSFSTMTGSAGPPIPSLCEPRTLVMIGAPISEGQDYDSGVAKAPQALRDGGLSAVVEEVGWGFEDRGDLDLDQLADTPVPNAPPVPSSRATIPFYDNAKIKNCEKIGRACGHIFDAVYNAANEGKFVLTVGGDHSLGCPTIAGVMRARPNACVVWVDAHGDCNHPETSPSGNYHGMPAAHAMGWFEKRARGFEWMDEHLSHPLKEDRIAFIGLRDIDPEERRLLRQSKVKCFTMTDVDRLGISAVMEEALKQINPRGDRPIHLSLDIDGIDPVIAPGTGTKAKGGLTYRESHYICERLAMTGQLGSMDLVEINPVMDMEILKKSRDMSSPQTAVSVSSIGQPLDDENKHGDCEFEEQLHGDNPLIRGTPTVRLGLELVESALGKTII
ncbi:Arginase, putative [Perkinsus marinus ATCC 50983]|uniref:Arginase n=1 Tax=Perkinsus marinus (strain ATCC 50983 / TXsc) TaxID=423536 RepID=C5LR61_PERM5|nr:Arginase, putative [Perkinsus marinus ATCC 50983]EER00946.1 Arginase, putative [Perkinsus marinus ATCC 50983]|eukprot:XP_002768228.1 Arginase, putative [Perkinsus marinus ATCC 50983]